MRNVVVFSVKKAQDGLKRIVVIPGKFLDCLHPRNSHKQRVRTSSFSLDKDVL